ncbi:MAG: hypothetical protein ABI949_08955 [Ilumatobacteraceae bacterium]
MDVLVIESSPGVSTTLQHRLIRDGHEVISCNDSHDGPCRGVESNGSCPMTKHVDFAVLARQHGTGHSLNEMGSVCALRHHVPLVTLYPGDEFGPRLSTEIAVAAARREVEAGYVAAVRRQVKSGIDDVDVERKYNRIRVTITVAKWLSEQTVGRLVDRVRQAVREYDSHTPMLDISVVRADTAVG